MLKLKIPFQGFYFRVSAPTLINLAKNGLFRLIFLPFFSDTLLRNVIIILEGKGPSQIKKEKKDGTCIIFR